MLCIAHRGASGHRPENTAAAFSLALEMAAPWMEFDVRLTADDELVVIHDPTVNRTSNGQGRVDEMTLAQLRELDFGRGEKILTLPELLELIDGRANLNIELCANGVAERVIPLIDDRVKQRKWQQSQFLLSSFIESELLTASRLGSPCRLGALTAGVPADIGNWASALNAWSVHFHFGFLSKAMVQEAHAAELQVFVYTVNDVADWRHCQSLGVDAVFTDFPDRMLENSG